MLKDKSVMKAVSMIRHRSERESNIFKINNTFVDPGILDEINNENHQIFFGRRGTGKTHVLRMLQSVWSNNIKTLPLFIDARILGSTSQFSDNSLPIKQRTLFLFRDILNEIHNCLLTSIINDPPQHSEIALESLDLFASSYSEKIECVNSYSIKETIGGTIDTRNQIGVKGSLKGSLSVEAKSSDSTKQNNEEVKYYEVKTEDKIIFPNLHKYLLNILDRIDRKLIILFDEWSSLPIDIQPYISEYIRKSFVPCHRIVIKIAALEYNSNFGTSIDNRLIGFELGADISTVPDLDSFYNFEENPKKLEKNFSEMLFRHVSSELPYDYLNIKYHVNDGKSMMEKIFSDGAFESLSYAAEGVVRDLINIFIISYTKLHRKKKNKNIGKKIITKSIIYDSSRQWFERDKFQNLPPNMQIRYQKIVLKLLNDIKSRYFIVSILNENINTLKKLVDLRVVHLAKKSLISFTEPYEVYNVFRIDFGSYISVFNIGKYTKPDSIQFFDKDSFSKFPNPNNDLKKHIIPDEYIE